MRKLAFLIAVIAVTAAACGDSDPVVAEVNGQEITESEVLDLRERLSDAVPAADFRNDLSRLILGQVVRSSLAEDFDVTVSAADVDNELEAQLESSGLELEAAIAALQEPGATEAMLRSNIEILLLRDGALSALGAQPEFIEGLFADSPTALTEVCARHILVETAGEAQDVLDRLAAGSDFAATADELSTDSSPGGDLGCRSPDAYVPEFAAATSVAPIGEVFGPVETQFGHHVILVTERTAPTLEEVMADPDSYIPVDFVRNEWTLWLNEKVAGADISVRSNIGTWSPDGQGIEPPG